MALSRKQTVIHLHGSSKDGLVANNFSLGELLILHATDGHAEFGTRVGNTLRWAPDQETIENLIKASLSGIQADAVTSVSGDTYVSATKEKNTVTLATAVATDFSKEITDNNKLADAKAIKTYVDGLNSTATGEIADINAKLGAGFTSGSTATNQLAEVKETADAALKTVTGENAIVATTGESQSVKVTLKIDDTTNGKGNVVFTNGENGLSANVTIPEATVTGVTGDILSLSDKLVNATVALDYGDATTEALKGKKAIKLLGKDNKVLSEIDASAFIKDGMINSVAFDEKTHVLTLTFNTEAGKDPITVDLKSLVDTYKAGDGLELATDGTFSVKDEIARVGTDADTKASNTVKGAKKYADDVKATVDAYTVNGKKISTSPTLTGTDIKVDSGDTAVTVKEAIEAAKTAGVTKFGGEIGDIELKASGSTNGTINLTMSGKTLQADIIGLKSAAFTETSAYDAAGEASKVLGTTDDDKTNASVYGVQAYVKEVETALENKNVSAGIPEGEILVSAAAADNKVTVSSTTALKTAVTNANSAVQNVTVSNNTDHGITVTKGTDNVVTINVDSMIIDCGEF